MIVLEFTLITFLIVCAIAFAFSKRLVDFCDYFYVLQFNYVYHLVHHGIS